MFLAGCFDRRLYFVVNDLFGTNTDTTKKAHRPQLHTHAGHRSHNSVDELGTSAIGLAGPDRLNVSTPKRRAWPSFAQTFQGKKRQAVEQMLGVTRVADT